MNLSCAVRILLHVCLFIVSGCATRPKGPVFQRYTMKVFLPKPANHPIPVLCERPNREFEPIGRFYCFGIHEYSDKTGSLGTGFARTSGLIEAAKAKARTQGADAIIVYEDSVRSEPYSREIRKCDPPTPNIPDKKHDKCDTASPSNSKNPKDGAACNPSDAVNTPCWYSETVTGRKYTLVFDVDMIVYTGSEKKPLAPTKTERQSSAASLLSPPIITQSILPLSLVPKPNLGTPSPSPR